MDVKAKNRTSDGLIVAGRTRVKGVVYAVSTAGADMIIYDNADAASGTVAVVLPAGAIGVHDVAIPGDGVVCENGVFLDINGAASATVFYG